MKKIIILILICASIFMIYYFNNKNEKLVFSIGNDTGDVFYKLENGRITDIIIGIETNQEIGDYDFQYLLVKATTISIDINSFMVLNSYSSILNQLNDLEKLLILIKKYSKEKIVIILIKDNTEFAEYANQKISILCKKYDIMITR